MWLQILTRLKVAMKFYQVTIFHEEYISPAITKVPEYK